MMDRFLDNHREELIARCKAKVAQRPRRAATEEQLKNGIPMFLDQLQRTLEAEDSGRSQESLQISGASGGDALALSEMSITATAHGKQLLGLGFTVDQVVHDYGDLCQAITDLAFEKDVPFGIDEFRTLNRCLDNAIAGAVTEFSAQRDASLARRQDAELNQRMGFLVHELRNSLGTAMLAVGALEVGNLPLAGATGAVLKRSMAALKTMIDNAIHDVRRKHEADPHPQTFYVASFIADAENAAALYAQASRCTFKVGPVDPLLAVAADRERLLAALANLLQNAFKFTRAHTQIVLTARAFGNKVLIEVADQCGGLPSDSAEKMFSPFSQRSTDRTGLGLGLSIARQSVEIDGGSLSVRDVPGTGCVFTITLPRQVLV